MQERSPWLSIWFHPRDTIKQIIVDNPKRGILWLAAGYGFCSLLTMFQSFGLSAEVDVFAVVLLSLVIAPFWGYLVFNFWTWIIMMTGRLFKGFGDFLSLRAAYSWSNVPLIISSFIWLLLVFIFGQTLFILPSQVYDPTFSIILLSLLLVKVIMSVWSLVIYLNVLAEVQQFSVFKAICNVVVSLVVVCVLLVLSSAFIMFILGVSVDQTSSASAAFQMLQQGKMLYDQSF